MTARKLTHLAIPILSSVLGLASCVAENEMESHASGEANPEYGVVDYGLSAEYAPAKWVPSPNFKTASRVPPAVTVIVVHTIQGSYQSAINWFLNTSAQVSSHYVVSKTGDITQMVQEKDIAWHVGSQNSYTIGIEHEGFVDDPLWATDAMLEASAKLTCHLLKKWNLPADRDHVKGHVELPKQTHTDPGQYWPWDTYMAKIGKCMVTVPVQCGDCNDKNYCTADSCVADKCVHTPKDGPCEDGDPCSVKDTCAKGVCAAGPATGCLDGGSTEDASSDASVAVDAQEAQDAGADLGPDPDSGTGGEDGGLLDAGLADAKTPIVGGAAPSSPSGCTASRASSWTGGWAALLAFALIGWRRRRA